jgi:hypothetical protein
MEVSMFKPLLILILCAALTTVGCASATPRLTVSQLTSPQSPAPQGGALVAEYVTRLPPGSKVRVERLNGKILRGTLMKATAEGLVVHENTRIPEPPVIVAMNEVARVTLEGESSVGKSIGVGIASGAGGTMAVFLLLAALFSD